MAEQTAETADAHLWRNETRSLVSGVNLVVLMAIAVGAVRGRALDRTDVVTPSGASDTGVTAEEIRIGNVSMRSAS